MFLALSGGFFVIFVINVSMGSITGTPLLGIVSEMILLFAASIAFVIAILKREAEAKPGNP
ncbi:hypothetical protein [Labrenzia sp. OB1]|uniref:hypothetical protein n=1 Tax=Labrenzia sp. OB1 TaxID=1561204 RepID=UPI0007B2DDF8|nr:hypothetical protein [Labrenzia sp. OB1]KZM51787.1 hypothetical protein OA90_00250 [Labrenzia sp. OB1]